MAWKEKEAKSGAFETHAWKKTGTHEHKVPIGVRRAANGNRKAMRWCSLHHHSTLGSYLDGFALPESHVRRAAELQIPAIAATEHGGIESHVQFEKASVKHNVKILFGCEIYLGYTDEERRTQKKYHLTVLAKNQQGYRNLLQLVSASYAEGFYYEPTVSLDMLERYKEGLVILSGCQGSLLFCSAVGGKLIPESEASYRRARKVALWFKRTFGDDYFLECQAFPELPKTRLFAPIAERLSRELHIGIVGTLDIHYTAPEEAEIQKVLHNVRPGEKRTLEELERSWGYNVPLCHPLSDKQIFGRLRETGLSRTAALEAIVNTELIANACEVTLPKLPMLEFPLPPGYESAQELWRDWLRDGWYYRGFDRLPYVARKAAKEKLQYEMGIIEEKGFESYFLLNSDVVRVVKDQGYPIGPARGSAAASLACYLLRITEVNPMLFPNLVFERFIDISRADWPDIDLDFSEEARRFAFEYLVGKYGEQSVGNLGTFTGYKAKNSLEDVARVHRIPSSAVEAVKSVLIERSSGDLRASATIEDTAEHFEQAAEVFKKYPALKMAGDLEGNYKGMGVHAAGLAVANGDIRDVCALYEREMEDGRIIRVLSMDKYDAERQGILKLDYLGLKTLDMLTYALEMIGMKLNDMYGIPLWGRFMEDGVEEDDYEGIFQYSGRATREIARKLHPDNFIEWCDVIALCRPGPLHSGASGEYIDAKQGRKRAESLHPALDVITVPTHRQIVYQEQILKVVTSIGGFDWTHASAIRRIISKKEGSAKFNQEWERFWEGAKTLHRRSDFPPVTEDVAKRIWNSCITAGAYAFNFSHCVSYGMLGVWSMYIKRTYPEVFYAAGLAKLPPGSKVPTQHERLMRDARKKGIILGAPDPVDSGKTWSYPGRVHRGKKYRPGLGRVLAGFEQIGGVGEKTAAKMVEAQPVKDWDGFLDIRGVGPKTIAKMKTMAEAADPFEIQKLDNLLTRVRRAGLEAALPMPTHTALQVPSEKGTDIEVVWIGVITKRNLRDIFESHRAKTGQELDPTTVKRPELSELVVLWGYDGTEVVTVRIDRFHYPKFKEAIWGAREKKDVIWIRGVKPGWRDAREIYAKEMWVIDPEEG
jgi:DNA polymerase-3 subunit alpha